MAESLLVGWYRELPEFRLSDDLEMLGAAMQRGLRAFRTRVRARYSEGTLQRLLHSQNIEERRAAILGLACVGTMTSNAQLAARLRDADSGVAGMAADALWEIWFRAGTDSQNRALQRAVQFSDLDKGLAALDRLTREAPEFAEAFNQRAILYFRRGDFVRSIQDCETALRLNPFHFGAQAGMGQCCLKLGKPRGALRAFRLAMELNPAMDGVKETIRALEASLPEGESRGDHHAGA